MRRSLLPHLNTLRREISHNILIATATLLGKIWLCHYVVMDFHCFRVALYVGLGPGWGVTTLLPDNLS